MRNKRSIIFSALVVGLFLGCGMDSGPKLPTHKLEFTAKSKVLKSFSFEKMDKDGLAYKKSTILEKLRKQSNDILNRAFSKSPKTSKNILFDIYYKTTYKITTSVKDSYLVIKLSSQECSKTKTVGAGTRNSCKKSTNVIFNALVDVKEQDNKYLVNINSISTFSAHAPDGTEYFANPGKSVMNINRRLGQLQKVEIERIKSVKIIGSVLSDYPVASLQSSVDRQLSQYFSEKTKYYILVAGEKHIITIDTFPFKNGSKLSYTIYLDYDAKKMTRLEFLDSVENKIAEKIKTISNS
jgi:hypothetical protein